MPKSKKAINVLSFDGGGSRGLMEVLALQDIMLILTIMVRNPKEIAQLVKENANFELPNSRQAIHALMEKVEDPIHPTSVFNYIVGKSKKLCSRFSVRTQLDACRYQYRKSHSLWPCWRQY